MDVVRADEVLGSHQDVDHLLALGHRRIAHVDGAGCTSRWSDGVATWKRWHRHGPAYHVRIIPGGSGEEEGARAAAGLLEDPPAAVTVFDDLAATGLLDVVRGHGRRVPGDLSVVGYDDSWFSRLGHIDLTTIAQDVTAMAGHAITRAVDRVEAAPTGGRETVAAPRLVVRGTTAVPG